jgi:hypothetical protein
MNISRRTFQGALAALMLSAGLASAAHADAIPYPTPGSYNAATYSFTAAADGNIVAYIVGGFSAGFENQLGLRVNGTAQGGFGLDNHSSSVGDSYNFGSVHAGDTLTFVLHDLSLGMDAYSNPSLNVAYDSAGETRHNHIYSTAYTATNPLFSGVPTGTYVAFEDLPFPGSDFNYNDESFVFTNTRVVTSVPEPASLALLGTGLLGAGVFGRRKRKAA